MKELLIAVSNDMNEEMVISLEKQEDPIDLFGIGTDLVTCENNLHFVVSTNESR